MLRHTHIHITWLLVAVMMTLVGARFFLDVSPVEVGYLIGQKASLIGIQVGVLPNDQKTIALRLQQKELALAEKERQLEARQNSAGASPELVITQNKVLATLLAAIALLFTLIVLNFYLDWRRRKSHHEL